MCKWLHYSILEKLKVTQFFPFQLLFKVVSQKLIILFDRHNYMYKWLHYPFLKKLKVINYNYSNLKKTKS